MSIVRAIVSMIFLPTVLYFSADWLVDPAPFKYDIVETKASLIIKNDLLQREIKLGPNAASISLKHIVTEEVVGSIRPDAEIVIDGIIIPPGGSRYIMACSRNGERLGHLFIIPSGRLLNVFSGKSSSNGGRCRANSLI